MDEQVMELFRESVKAQEAVQHRLESLGNDVAQLREDFSRGTVAQEKLTSAMELLTAEFAAIRKAEVEHYRSLVQAEKTKVEAQQKRENERENLMLESVRGFRDLGADLIRHPMVAWVVSSLVTYLLVKWGIPVAPFEPPASMEMLPLP